MINTRTKSAACNFSYLFIILIKYFCVSSSNNSSFRPETRVIARGNTKIFNQDNKEIGKITSGTFGPSVDHSIAMGYVENTYANSNTKLFLEVRGKKIAANICNLPFYKKNYVKGEINV